MHGCRDAESSSRKMQFPLHDWGDLVLLQVWPLFGKLVRTSRELGRLDSSRRPPFRATMGAMRYRSSQGLYLVILTALVVALLGAAALVVGVGYLSTARAQLQNLASVTSLAAVEAFNSSLKSAYGQKLDDALLRANQILEANGGVPGISGSFGSLATTAMGEGGRLEMGLWYPEWSADPSCPTQGAAGCCTAYPCFRANPIGAPDTQGANAARVTVRTTPTNPLVLPFAKLLAAQSTFDLQSTAITAATQKCFVFLLDVSLSTVAETHVPFILLDKDQTASGLPPGYPITVAGVVPSVVAVSPRPSFAIPSDPNVNKYLPGYSSFFAAPSNITSGGLCTAPATFGPGSPWSDYFKMWCSMEQSRASAVTSPLNPGRNPPDTRINDTRYHFRSDYTTISTDLYGPLLVDIYANGSSYGYANSNPALPDYEGPEPYTRFMRAFNVGIRWVQNIKSPGDEGALMVFAGDIRGSEPPQPVAVSDPKLSTDLSTLIKLTNLDNRIVRNYLGQVARLPTPPASDRLPNAISKGWVPMMSTDYAVSGTNMVGAINSAIDRLASCPDTAQKSIILATDGIITCSPPGTNPSTDCVDGGSATDDTLARYAAAKDYILTTLRDRLVSTRISVTTLLDSDAVAPSFLNSAGLASPAAALVGNGCAASSSLKPCASSVFNLSSRVNGVSSTSAAEPDWGTSYMVWRNTRALADPCYSASLVVGTEPTACVNRFAIANLGLQGINFRDPIGWTQQLAKETDGVVCVIQPQCTLADCPGLLAGHTGPYDPSGALYPECRTVGQYQGCSLSNNSKAEQAFSCVLAALGSVPYQPVEPG